MNASTLVHKYIIPNTSTQNRIPRVPAGDSKGGDT